MSKERNHTYGVQVEVAGHRTPVEAANAWIAECKVLGLAPLPETLYALPEKGEARYANGVTHRTWMAKGDAIGMVDL